MPKPSHNDIVEQLVQGTQRILADPAGAPDPFTQAQNEKNADRQPLYDLYSPEPLITGPTQIVEPEVYDKFDRLTNELIITNNQEEAFKLAGLLEDLLYKYNTGLRQQNPFLFQKYEKLMYLCNYVSITSLNLNEIEALVSAHTVLALSKNINVLQKLDSVLTHYHDFLMEGAIAEKLSIALSKSDEFLGSESIKQTGENNLPSRVSNWLKDYLMSSHVSSEQQRSGFQRVGYIEKSANVLKLSKEDQIILYNIIKIYDWLAYGSQAVSEENDFNTLGIATQPKITQQLPKSPPLVPAPKTALNFKSMDDVAGGQRVGKIGESSFAPNSAKATADKSESRRAEGSALVGSNKSPTPNRPVNIQDILKKREHDLPAGLRMGEGGGGNGGNYNNKDKNNIVKPLASNSPVAKQPMSINQKSRQAEIDKKLEELEKRVENKNN